VRILLDECVNQRFRHELLGHSVSTVQESGWTGKKNSELLKLAQNQFEVFITVDRNLYFQQNFNQFKMAVVVLSARTNRLQYLRPLIPELLGVLSKMKSGEVKIIPETADEGGS